MGSGATTPTIEVSTTIAAPPDRLYAMVSDVTRMGEWSPECFRCTWVRGATGPAVGARFRGWNRKGWRRWWTDATVTKAEPGKEFAFAVSSFGLPVAGWGYRFEPSADGGTVVTEYWNDRRQKPMAVVSGVAVGVADREGHNRRGMEQTLQRIKAVAEAGS